jgi:hypothetical protein
VLDINTMTVCAPRVQRLRESSEHVLCAITQQAEAADRPLREAVLAHLAELGPPPDPATDAEGLTWWVARLLCTQAGEKLQVRERQLAHVSHVLFNGGLVRTRRPVLHTVCIVSIFCPGCQLSTFEERGLYTRQWCRPMEHDHWSKRATGSDVRCCAKRPASVLS